MPPLPLEEEADETKNGSESDGGDVGDIPPRAAKAPSQQLEEDLQEAADEANGADDDGEDDGDEDEYVVEKIESHKFDSKGKLMLQVRWQGYEEMTWEPEANMTGCPDELDAYYKQVGGKPKFQAKGKSAPSRRLSSDAPARGTKRKAGIDSPTAASTTPDPAIKRDGRKSKPGANADGKQDDFEPPKGSWENDLIRVEAMERRDNKVWVMVQWRNGRKTKHSSDDMHKKAPRMMCEFYAAHLYFPTEGDP